MRDKGYYWVKVTEKIKDNGGPNSDSWIIEYWNGISWDVFYGGDDSCFSVIHNESIKEP